MVPTPSPKTETVLACWSLNSHTYVQNIEEVAQEGLPARKIEIFNTPRTQRESLTFTPWTCAILCSRHRGLNAFLSESCFTFCMLRNTRFLATKPLIPFPSKLICPSKKYHDITIRLHPRRAPTIISTYTYPFTHLRQLEHNINSTYTVAAADGHNFRRVSTRRGGGGGGGGGGITRRVQRSWRRRSVLFGRTGRSATKLARAYRALAAKEPRRVGYTTRNRVGQRRGTVLRALYAHVNDDVCARERTIITTTIIIIIIQ